MDKCCYKTEHETHRRTHDTFTQQAFDNVTVKWSVTVVKNMELA